MLTTCPECSQTVSTKADACPHCGYPFRQARRRVTRRRRSLPNGFGQITKIPGLTNPYRAMVTTGHTDEGRPIAKLLKPRAYFPTYNDAYAALAAYHASPYDPLTDPTLAELFDRWQEMRAKTSSATVATKQLTSVWRYCGSIANMRVREFRPRHLRVLLDVAALPDGTKASPATLVRIKTLFNQLMDYAVEYELLPTNYARAFDLPENIARAVRDKKHHVPFSPDDLSILWANIDRTDLIADLIVVTCYSGWRPGELIALRLDDLDLDAHVFRGGLKTDAGRDRPVPIHPKICGIVRRHAELSRAAGLPNIFTDLDGDGRRVFTQRVLGLKYAATVKALGLPAHTPHDGRATFITLAKAADVDEYAIKYIVGHAIRDLTEGTYTTRDPAWLLAEISKIP